MLLLIGLTHFLQPGCFCLAYTLPVSFLPEKLFCCTVASDETIASDVAALFQNSFRAH